MNTNRYRVSNWQANYYFKPMLYTLLYTSLYLSISLSLSPFKLLVFGSLLYDVVRVCLCILLAIISLRKNDLVALKRQNSS